MSTVSVTNEKRLKGGLYNNQLFSQIQQQHASNTNASWSLTKGRVTQQSLEQAVEILNNYAKLLGGVSAFGGGSAMEAVTLENIVKLFKSGRIILNPVTTTLGPQALRSASAAEQLLNVLKAYSDLHLATETNPTPAIGKGMYSVTNFVQVWGGVPGASGYSRITSYYDVTTKQYLGDVSE